MLKDNYKLWSIHGVPGRQIGRVCPMPGQPCVPTDVLHRSLGVSGCECRSTTRAVYLCMVKSRNRSALRS
jgi:hypothetical protein